MSLLIAIIALLSALIISLLITIYQGRSRAIGIVPKYDALLTFVSMFLPFAAFVAVLALVK